MQVTCLVIGDPHIKVTDLKASKEMCQEVLRIAKETSPDFIVCLGDTLDRHETIHTEPLTVAIKWLSELKDIAPVYLLIGNHDRINNSDFLTDKHPFIGLKNWNPSRMKVVDTTLIDEIHGLKFFFVPYVPPGRFIEALEVNPEWDSSLNWSAGFTHQEIYGIKMGSIISDKGDKWPIDWPTLINGHIHDRHVPQKNVISIGTPRQHAFGENPDKSLSLFTFSANSKIEERRIRLNLPQKIIIRIQASELDTFEVPESKNHYKLEITGTSAEIRALLKLDRIKELKRLGIKVVTKDIEAGRKRVNDAPLPINEWQDKTFKQRLQLRIKEESPEVEAMYKKIFGRKKISLRTKKSNVPTKKITLNRVRKI